MDKGTSSNDLTAPEGPRPEAPLPVLVVSGTGRMIPPPPKKEN